MRGSGPRIKVRVPDLSMRIDLRGVSGCPGHVRSGRTDLGLWSWMVSVSLEDLWFGLLLKFRVEVIQDDGCELMMRRRREERLWSTRVRSRSETDCRSQEVPRGANWSAWSRSEVLVRSGSLENSSTAPGGTVIRSASGTTPGAGGSGSE